MGRGAACLFAPSYRASVGFGQDLGPFPETLEDTEEFEAKD